MAEDLVHQSQVVFSGEASVAVLAVVVEAALAAEVLAVEASEDLVVEALAVAAQAEAGRINFEY